MWSWRHDQAFAQGGRIPVRECGSVKECYSSKQAGTDEEKKTGFESYDIIGDATRLCRLCSHCNSRGHVIAVTFLETGS